MESVIVGKNDTTTILVEYGDECLKWVDPSSTLTPDLIQITIPTRLLQSVVGWLDEAKILLGAPQSLRLPNLRDIPLI